MRGPGLIAMLLISGACRGGTDASIDADVPDPDAAPPRATLFEDSSGCFFSEIYERFAVNHGDGSPGDSGAIDADGTTVDVEPGDVVTASTFGGALQSVLGVAPGDALTFGEVCGPPDITFEFSAGWDSHPAASYYVACSRCYCMPTIVGGLSKEIGSCSDAVAGIDDLLVVAMDSSATPVAFSWNPGITVGAGAFVSAGPWQDPDTLTMSVEAIPEIAVVTSRIIFGNSYVASQERSAGTGTTWDRLAAPQGAPVEVHLGVGAEELFEAVPAGSATWILSITDRLPEVTSFTFDPASRAVSFAVEGTVGHDAAVLDLVWPLGDARVRTWRVIVPSGTTSFSLPAHPDMPETTELGDGRPSSVRIALVERADIDTYDALRGVPLWAMRNGYMALRDGASGVVRWATYFPTAP